MGHWCFEVSRLILSLVFDPALKLRGDVKVFSVIMQLHRFRYALALPWPRSLINDAQSRDSWIRHA